MGVLILNQSAASFSPYHQWLKELKAPVVLLSSSPKELADPSYLNFFAHSKVYDDYQNSSEVELDAIRLHESFHFKSIIALSPNDALRAARIREHLNLANGQLERTLLLQNRAATKAAASKITLVQAHRTIRSVFDLVEFWSRYPCNVVLRSDNRSTSNKIFCLSKERHLIRFLERGLPLPLQPFVAEQLIKGTLYQVTGLMVEGEIRFCWATRYLRHPMLHPDEEIVATVILSDSNPILPDLIQEAKRIVPPLAPQPTTLFHVKLFQNLTNEIVFSDVNFSGNSKRLNDLFLSSFNIHLNQRLVQEQVKLSFPDFPLSLIHYSSTPLRLSRFVLSSGKKGVIRSLPQRKPKSWVFDYSPQLAVGDFCPRPSKGENFLASFVVSGDNEEMLCDRLHSINAWFQSQADIESIRLAPTSSDSSPS